MTKDEVRQTIDKNGWRQGSIISFSRLQGHIGQQVESPVSLPDPTRIKKPGSAYVVVINMSCDVVYGAVDQLPQVKCLLCWAKDDERSNGEVQDPRQMLLQWKGQTLAFRMKDRLFVHKHILCHIQPDDQLSDDQVNSLVRWKVAQFNRLGLPESLAGRIGDIFDSSEFRNWTKQTAPKLEGVFLEIKPMSELPSETPYKVGVLAVANSSETNLADIHDIADKVEELILGPLRNTPGIELLNDSDEYAEEGQEPAVSSSEFSYDMLKRFRRFYLDHHSLDPDANTAPVSV